ncbi:hypothetical protein PYCCODRAFT_1047383 [Trametes coccinea BRFM310]|uniref:MYND-type domain-containing protein n=1 Tax=Trametes coccinea (strain BRFM310) TaxID=1353009 RepID=A0A1Y2IBX8_TRAC3|nr:hypothetical protein PYCCODRAFT_1047383 [Trametes coccinea BRFM310]
MAAMESSSPRHGCRKAWYCSQRCQKEDWIMHIFDCKLGQPISTVYHLARACRRDLIPVDWHTRKDYGFDRAGQAFGGAGESKLLGVYIGLFNYLNVPPKDVRTWRDEGRLVEGIKEAFDKIPAQSRGAYYPWLMQNRFILDDSLTLDTTQALAEEQESLNNGILVAWALIGGHPKGATPDQILHQTKQWPAKKLACWQLYAMLAGRSRPGPDLAAWRSFGFVVAGPTGEELEMARQYRALIHKCTFDEFHAAYASSSIPDLFRRYGLQDLANNSRFCDLMSDPSPGMKSVWGLKQYLDILISSDPSSRPKPSLPVSVDYGYANCKNLDEHKLLDEAYKRLFMETSADPLELHQACIKGDLFRFVGKFVKFAPWAKKYKRLLRNNHTKTDPKA